MKQSFIPVICGALLTIMFASATYAADGALTVAVSPVEAKPGDAITIATEINNPTTSTATITVVFKVGETPIGAPVVATVPKNSKKMVTTLWTMPTAQTTVTAVIRSALTTTKKDIPTLTGMTGTVTVGAVPTIEFPDLSSARGFVGRGIAQLETWRVGGLAYFTTLKTANSDILKTNINKDVQTLLLPESPGVPTVGGGTATSTTPIVSGEDKSRIFKYGLFIVANLGVSFFDHKAIYYISIILAALFVLRFVLGRFI